MRHARQSPYARAIDERRAELHPALQRYFDTLPEGTIGVGEGVFTHVGTPRRWLWPLLRLLQHRGVVFAGWEQQVPFRIVNRLVDGRATSEREFLLPGGSWTMRDAVALRPNGLLVDELGEPATVAAGFDLSVIHGALRMTSTAVGVRLGRLRVRLPRLLSPVVQVTEQFDEGIHRQHVNVTIDVPFLGRIYEYAGHFEYRIEKEQA